MVFLLNFEIDAVPSSLVSSPPSTPKREEPAHFSARKAAQLPCEALRTATAIARCTPPHRARAKSSPFSVHSCAYTHFLYASSWCWEGHTKRFVRTCGIADVKAISVLLRLLTLDLAILILSAVLKRKRELETMSLSCSLSPSLFLSLCPSLLLSFHNLPHSGVGVSRKPREEGTSRQLGFRNCWSRKDASEVWTKETSVETALGPRSPENS